MVRFGNNIFQIEGGVFEIRRLRAEVFYFQRWPFGDSLICIGIPLFCPPQPTLFVTFRGISLLRTFTPLSH